MCGGMGGWVAGVGEKDEKEPHLEYGLVPHSAQRPVDGSDTCSMLGPSLKLMKPVSLHPLRSCMATIAAI